MPALVHFRVSRLLISSFFLLFLGLESGRPDEVVMLTSPLPSTHLLALDPLSLRLRYA